jgi:hypothetical protein
LLVSNQVVTNKVTFVIDDMWLAEIMTKMIPFVEADEIFQVVKVEEVEICADCQTYLSSDKEVIMENYKCYYQQEFCLNCCGCEEHEGERWY